MTYKEYEPTYSLISEPKEEQIKQLHWNIAIGLQEVDNLEPSTYLLELADDNIAGDKSTEDIEKLLDTYYKKQNLEDEKVHDKYECDKVSTRIVKLIGSNTYSFYQGILKNIHKDLFKNIYKFAGEYRAHNITKDEFILNKDTVKYYGADAIELVLENIFKEEETFDYTKLSTEEQINHFATLTSKIWHVHPFLEGNTRTVAVFMIKYLNNMGYSLTNDLFKNKSKYFRNALVRSCYSRPLLKIYPTFEPLIKFYENLLLDKKHILKSRDLIVKELFP